MQKYNLYYNGDRLNKSAITQKELEKIIAVNRPVKRIIGDDIIEIPLHKIRIVKCTIV